MLVHIVFKTGFPKKMSPSRTPGKKRHAVFRPVFYRAKRGKLLDAALVRDLYDLNTEKYYYSAQNFYQDFLQSRRLAAEQAEEIKSGAGRY